ncbi:MAG: hypothetical protein EA404_12755 [Spirochaetaceae bacterium]|nr:MAG: hypothetical protein EA404_12755 [Spirochaetaceae bacterium]
MKTIATLIILALLTACSNPFGSNPDSSVGQSGTEPESEEVQVDSPDSFAEWNHWSITQSGRDFTEESFQITGKVYFSALTTGSTELDKMYITLRDDDSALFGVKFLANSGGSHQRKSADLGTNLGGQARVEILDSLWTADGAVPFSFSYDGEFITLLVAGVERGSYSVTGLSGATSVRVTIVERTTEFRAELRNMFLNDKSLGSFKTE